MPRPRGPGRLDPDDLAKRIAARLAETAPTKRRFSLRNSVVVGRLLSGVIVLVATATLVGVIFLGVDWLTGRSPAATPSQSTVDEDLTEPGLPGFPGTTVPATESGITTTTIGGPFATTVPWPGIGLPALPPPTTTTVPGTTSPRVTTTQTAPVTTKAPTTSSSTSTPTTAPTTSTSSSTSTSTTTEPSTTTTLAPTTTTMESTTTTTESTTTTLP